MRVRTFGASDVVRIISNRDNPKTMDYYFVRLLNVKFRYADIYPNGHFNVTLVSNNDVLSESLHQLRRHTARDFVGRSIKLKEQLFFILDLFEDRILPKCRTLKIIGRHKRTVQVANPKAGVAIPPPKGAAHSFYYPMYEPSFFPKAKCLYVYCRNNWDRKGELKIDEQAETEANVAGDNC